MLLSTAFFAEMWRLCPRCDLRYFVSTCHFLFVLLQGVACLMSMLLLFQVLKGDIKPAIEIHEMLYQVTQIHNFLPEVSCIAFTANVG